MRKGRGATGVDGGVGGGRDGDKGGDGCGGGSVDEDGVLRGESVGVSGVCIMRVCLCV